MAQLAPDSMALAATALGNGVRCLLVTLGKRGAVYFAQPDFDGLGSLDGRLAGAPTEPAFGPVRTALIPAEPVHGETDPTGCGDVWGATCFSRLLAGAKLSDSIAAAHRAAARNLEHRGASGLASHLRGEIARP
jgi:sugar/nucleoside kinase (ribokinase family)